MTMTALSTVRCTVTHLTHVAVTAPSTVWCCHTFLASCDNDPFSRSQKWWRGGGGRAETICSTGMLGYFFIFLCGQAISVWVGLVT